MMLIGFIRVPLILYYLNPTKYGIWLIIGSIIGWFGFLDIGLGNGLRNKLAGALAKDDIKLAQTYVSTTYALLIIIIGVLLLLFVLINPILDWTKILNASPELAADLSKLALIVITFFSIQFVLDLVGIVLLADQMPAFKDALTASGSLVYLIVIFILIKTTSGSLLYIAIASGGSQAMVFALASYYLYKKKYRHIMPSFRHVNFRYSKDLVGLGAKFFVIQIAVVIMFSTDNIIITQLFSPAEVVPYSIAHRYFFLVITIFSIAMAPFWTATTEAYNLNDFHWIKNIIRKIIYLWLALVAAVAVMLLISSCFYKIWIGDMVDVPFKLSLGMALFAVVRTWNSPFSSFANGVSKINLQFYITILIGIVNIPLSIIFAKYFHMGVVGVILATVVCLAVPAVLMPIQYLKIINNTATGIWNK